MLSPRLPATGDNGTTARAVHVALLATVFAGLAVVWWRTDDRPPLNVVLITLDTTRADRLSPYGYMDASMPAFERLGREGVVFDQATSVAPLTLPSHTSLLTGLYPPAHGVRDNADAALFPHHTTLAEMLRAEGLCTGAFVSSAVLGPDRGLAQGFQQYQGIAGDGGTPTTHQRRATAVVDDAIRWLDDIGPCPALLWTHFYDPHRPYEPPEPFLSRHADPYVGEIAFVDSQVGRLLDALEQRRRLENSIVVVAGDHGESLGEHGEDGHGIFVYESVLRVPLIIRPPGGARQPAPTPRRVQEVVRLVDVLPTILDLLGRPVPPMDGVSLVGLIGGTRSGLGLEAYAESMYHARLGGNPLRALREGRYKLIQAPRPELYDLERDPFETRNISEDRRTVTQAMTARLDAIAARGPEPPAAADVPADLSDRLRALGYIGAPPPPSRRAEDTPDPKECIGAPAPQGHCPAVTGDGRSVRIQKLRRNSSGLHKTR